MKNLYKRFYTQQEVESYDINKLENVLESGKNYPFERHGDRYFFSISLIVTSIALMSMLYTDHSVISRYPNVNIIQVMWDMSRDFILDASENLLGVISATLIMLLWHNAFLTIPLLLYLYYRDRKFANHRNAFYHKNVAMLQDELTRKKDAQAVYQARLVQAQKELTDKTDAIQKELEVKYDIQF